VRFYEIKRNRAGLEKKEIIAAIEVLATVKVNAHSAVFGQLKSGSVKNCFFLCRKKFRC
jgi:hypothetical protein